MPTDDQERRNRRARELGFRNEYDRRTHGSEGERLRRARGHASVADLERDLRLGRVEAIIQTPEGSRNDQGQYEAVTITVQLPTGEQRQYRLTGQTMSPANLDRLRDAALAGGADVYMNPSLDLLSLAGQAAGDDDLDYLDDLIEDYDE